MNVNGVEWLWYQRRGVASYTVRVEPAAHSGPGVSMKEPFGHGSIRVDGQALHPAYLFEVKRPAESRGAWDTYNLLATTPLDRAFRPLSQSDCALVKT